jgi:hypothetical protein
VRWDDGTRDRRKAFLRRPRIPPDSPTGPEAPPRAATPRRGFPLGRRTRRYFTFRERTSANLAHRSHRRQLASNSAFAASSVGARPLVSFRADWRGCRTPTTPSADLRGLRVPRKCGPWAVRRCRRCNPSSAGQSEMRGQSAASQRHHLPQIGQTGRTRKGPEERPPGPKTSIRFSRRQSAVHSTTAVMGPRSCTPWRGKSCGANRSPIIDRAARINVRKSNDFARPCAPAAAWSQQAGARPKRPRLAVTNA